MPLTRWILMEMQKNSLKRIFLVLLQNYLKEDNRRYYLHWRETVCQSFYSGDFSKISCKTKRHEKSSSNSSSRTLLRATSSPVIKNSTKKSEKFVDDYNPNVNQQHTPSNQHKLLSPLLPLQCACVATLTTKTDTEQGRDL